VVRKLGLPVESGAASRALLLQIPMPPGGRAHPLPPGVAARQAGLPWAQECSQTPADRDAAPTGHRPGGQKGRSSEAKPSSSPPGPCKM